MSAPDVRYLHKVAEQMTTSLQAPMSNCSFVDWYVCIIGRVNPLGSNEYFWYSNTLPWPKRNGRISLVFPRCWLSQTLFVSTPSVPRRTFYFFFAFYLLFLVIQSGALVMEWWSIFRKVRVIIFGKLYIFAAPTIATSDNWWTAFVAVLSLVWTILSSLYLSRDWKHFDLAQREQYYRLPCPNVYFIHRHYRSVCDMCQRFQ